MIVSFADQEEKHRAIDHGHLKIENQQIIILLEGELEAVFGIGRRVHLARQEGHEGLAHDAGQRDVIIHNEKTFYGAIAHDWTLARNHAAFQALVSEEVGRYPKEMEKAIVDLIAALRERLALVADEKSRRHPARHMERLRDVSEKIDNAQAALPHPINPRLAHFLERRSYEKALELLERQKS